MKVAIPVYLTGGFVALQWFLLIAALLASDHSYAIWTTAGSTSVLMMFFGALAGIISLIVALLGKNRTAGICGALLFAGCAMPVVLLLVAGSMLGL
jgi:hypothetical protein